MNLQHTNGTTAGRTLSPYQHKVLFVGGALASFDVTSSVGDVEWVAIEQTSSGQRANEDPINRGAAQLSTSGALTRLRMLSGLTWDQLAGVFGVARRSLHFWASGKPLSSGNEQRLREVLATIEAVYRGSASATRVLLMEPLSDGSVPLDLLADEKFQRLRRDLGGGRPVRHHFHTPLSADVAAARRPTKPQDLVDARHDTIHREIGRSRAGRSARSKK